MATTRGFKPKPPPLPQSEQSTEGANLPATAGARLEMRAAKYNSPSTGGPYKPFYVLRKERHFTAAKKEIFIFSLAEIGTTADAAEAAGISPDTARRHKNPSNAMYDPDFAEAWADAVEAYNAGVEREIHARAITGWKEPVFGGKDKDRIVGHLTKKSDRLLTTLAKRRMPNEYGEKIELTKVGGGDSKATEIAPGMDLAHMTTVQRKKLKEFLTSMDGVDRSEVVDVEAEAVPQIEDASEG